MKAQSHRLPVLDGWRGLSIVSVMACHLLPLGPSSLDLNASAGFLGMSLFFTLSGFLITTNLYHNRHVLSFYIRRITRIVPLACLYLTVAFSIQGAPIRDHLPAYLFAQNYLYSAITPKTTHIWSLCVEIHFYLSIGLFMYITKFKGFKWLPLVLLMLIGLRIYLHAPYNINTHLRVDEIISGACLALVYLRLFDDKVRQLIVRIPWWAWLCLLLLSCHRYFIPLMYFRGVFASCLVGHTLFTSEKGKWKMLCSGPLRYIAEISYALYVWHPLTTYGWLGSGEVIAKYLKRPLCFALSFGLAHLSTHYYEMPITNLGRKISSEISKTVDYKKIPAKPEEI